MQRGICNVERSFDVPKKMKTFPIIVYCFFSFICLHVFMGVHDYHGVVMINSGISLNTHFAIKNRLQKSFEICQISCII